MREKLEQCASVLALVGCLVLVVLVLSSTFEGW